MGTLQNLALKRLWPETEPSTAWYRALLVTGRYLFALGRDLASGELSLRAMSLVYTTMLSIVPVFGFSFALAKGLGYHEQLEGPLRQALEPLGEARAAEITGNLIGFAERINGGILGVLSVGLFLITVLSMAQKVEGSFNYVWRVDRPRSLARRFSEYLSVILIGPLLIATAAALIGILSSTDAVEWLRSIGPIGTAITYAGDLLPFAMTVAVFMFLYVFIPNTRVRFRPALLGGFAGGVSWAAGGYLFTTLVVASARLQSVYSGFAIVLLAMLWLYLSWLILLLGSQLTYYLQNPFHLLFGQRTDPLDNDARERLCLSIMCLVASDYAHPSHGWTRESLAATLRIPRSALEPVMSALVNAELLTSSGDERLLPGRDPHHIRLTDILASVRGQGSNQQWLGTRDSWNETVSGIADRIEQAVQQEFGDKTLGQLVDENLSAQGD